eukprot:5544691-Prymnesium_polylepis.1
MNPRIRASASTVSAFVACVGCAAAWRWVPPFRRSVAYVFLHYIKYYTQRALRQTVRQYTKDDPVAKLDKRLSSLHLSVSNAESTPFVAALQEQFVKPALKTGSGRVLRAALSRGSVGARGERQRRSSISGGARNRKNLKGLALTQWIKERIGGSGSLFRKVPLRVTRSAVFDSSVDALLAASAPELAAGISVMFLDDDGRRELGIDAGGLTKEWFALVCSQLEVRRLHEYFKDFMVRTLMLCSLA